MRDLSQDSWSLGRDLNPAPSKHELGVLTARLHCLVPVCHSIFPKGHLACKYYFKPHPL
jgi:hypothetical protein